MRRTVLLGLSLSIVAAVSGCATKEPYDWGSYEKSLYVYYKNPATGPDFAAGLQVTISAAERDRAVVAPGLNAEYGYLLLQQGNHDGAVAAFRKEEAQWPESKAFMDHMIQVTSNDSVGKASTKGP
jgi:hypothetical protein